MEPDGLPIQGGCWRIRAKDRRTAVEVRRYRGPFLIHDLSISRTDPFTFTTRLDPFTTWQACRFEWWKCTGRKIIEKTKGANLKTASKAKCSKKSPK